MSQPQTTDDIVRDWTFCPGDLVTSRAFRSRDIGVVISVDDDSIELYSTRIDMYVVAWSLPGGGMKIQDGLRSEHIAHVRMT